MKPAVDTKRTVNAAIGSFSRDNGRIQDFADPGVIEPHDNYIILSCPGCGSVSGMSIGPQQSSPRWLIESGHLKDVANLTLSPSINCVGCCGWHGHLKNGIFSI